MGVEVEVWCGVVCSRSGGEGSSPKNDEQFIMHTQEHKQSWKGRERWSVVCVVVLALLVVLSSMRCLLCGEKNDMSRH